MNLNKQEIKKLDFINDFLLYEEVFIDNYLNIYGLLVKKEDMQNNKKGIILKRCPYVYDEKEEIKQLIHKLENYNFITLRQALSDYLNIKRVRKDTFYNWLNKKIYPLPLVRTICFLLNENVLKLLKDKVITDFCEQSQIKFPSSHEEICSNFMAYFVGLHFGDGTLNNERWKIVDGDRDIPNLRYSYEFLTKIKNKLTKTFSTNSLKLYKVKNKNAYELVISNKWFCRYLNFVYKIEYRKKENPIVPDLFQNKEKLVLRGMFDTDGSIKNYRVSMGTTYKRLYEWICKILNKHEIRYKEKINKVQRKNDVYAAEIKKEDIFKFINTIGFSHPRKMLEVKKYLLTSSSVRNFINYSKEYKPKISEEKFIEVCQYLRPIKDSGKVRLTSDFKILDSTKKKVIINNIKINFDINKEPNKAGYINSSKVQRILSNYCRYEKLRNKTSDKEIETLMDNLSLIWQK